MTDYKNEVVRAPVAWKYLEYSNNWNMTTSKLIFYVITDPLFELIPKSNYRGHFISGAPHFSLEEMPKNGEYSNSVVTCLSRA